MRRGLILAGLLLTLPSLFVAVAPGQKAALPEITHGPILGRPGAHHVAVWVRTKSPGKFRVRYGTAAGKFDRVSPEGVTRLEDDNTGWVLIDGLEADTKYFYEVAGTGEGERGGWFLTLPDGGAVKDAKLNPEGLFNFSFEYACCNNQYPGRGSGPALPTFRTMLRELHGKIHFALHNGDWLYEDEDRTYPVADWMKEVGITRPQLPQTVEVAPTIVGVWKNYKNYLDKGKNLAAWHRNVPSLFTFDDHEMLNDVWGAGQAGVRERRAVFRDIGEAAWHDYLGWADPIAFRQPILFGKAQLQKGSDVVVDPGADFDKIDWQQASTLHVHWGRPNAGVDDNSLDAEKPGNPNAGVFEVVKVIDRHTLKIRPAAYADGESPYSIGRRSYFRYRVSNCEFFCLDTRSHRDMHDLENPNKPGISMIGEQQKAWLKEGMKNSDADFLFVVSSVNFTIPHRGGGAVRAENKDDSWTVFIQEREELIRFWDGLGKPVLVLTGDLHNSFVIRITDNVWEMGAGPHNSDNHRVMDEGERPANGTFDSEGRKVEIRWSTSFLNDIPRTELLHHTYCVVKANNVYNNPLKLDGPPRWVAYPRPQLIFQFFDGRTGELRYAESIVGRRGR